MAKRKMTFDKSIEELENIINIINDNDTNLEKSVELYKKGIDLLLNCHETINSLENEVKVLVSKADGTFKIEPFENLADEERFYE